MPGGNDPILLPEGLQGLRPLFFIQKLRHSHLRVKAEMVFPLQPLTQRTFHQKNRDALQNRS